MNKLRIVEIIIIATAFLFIVVSIIFGMINPFEKQLIQDSYTGIMFLDFDITKGDNSSYLWFEDVDGNRVVFDFQNLVGFDDKSGRVTFYAFDTKNSTCYVGWFIEYNQSISVYGNYTHNKSCKVPVNIDGELVWMDNNSLLLNFISV